MAAMPSGVQQRVPFPGVAFNGGRPHFAGRPGFINFAWGAGDDIVLFASPTPSTAKVPTSSTSTAPASAPGTCAVVQLERFHTDPKRKLMSESFDVFTDVGEQAPDKPGRSDELRACLNAASRRYRAAMSDCIDSLESVDDLDDDEGTEEDLELAEQMKLTNAVWHFCEIVFLSPDSHVAGKVVDWLQEHTGSDVPDSHLAQLRTTRRGNPEELPLFWDTVFAYVMAGEFAAAATTMALDSRITPTRDDVSSQIQALLAQYPVFRPTVGQSEMDYQSRWTKWHKEVLEVRREGAVGSLGEDAEALLEVLAGEVAGERLRVLARGHWHGLLHESWFSLLKAKLLFQKPVVALKLSSLSHLFAASFAESSSAAGGAAGEAAGSLLTCLRSILRGSAAAALKYMQDLQQFWAAAHLGDLLWRYEILNLRERFPGWDVGFRDHMLLEYSCLLARESGLWQLACNYAMAVACPVGKHLAEAIVERVELSTDRTATKVAALCSQRLGLPDLAAGVHRVRARAWISRGKWGQSLRWALRARSQPQMRFVARQLLQLCDEGSLQAGQEVDSALCSIGDHPLLRSWPLLHFAAQYRAWQLVMQDLHSVTSKAAVEGGTAAAEATRQFLRAEAARRLHLMLCGRLDIDNTASCRTPPAYRLHLLRAARDGGLLAGSPCCFDARQAHDMVTSFQDLLLSHRAKDFTKMLRDGEATELKLLLTKLLAASIVDAATTTKPTRSTLSLFEGPPVTPAEELPTQSRALNMSMASISSAATQYDQ